MPARSFDAVVIGAGVVGASIAFHLAEARFGRIALVDRGAVCSGNTRKSGALVRMHYSNEPETRMALASLSYFHDWPSRIGGQCGFQKTGFAILVGPNNADRLRRRVTRLQGWGVNTREITMDELREAQPGVDVDGIGAAAYEPDSGYADPVATTNSLVAAAQRMGVELLEHTPVRSISVAGKRVDGVTIEDGRLNSPVVVCAANTWSPNLLATAGVRLDLWPRRAQFALYARPAELPRQLVLIDTLLGVYTRGDGPDRTLGGLSALTGDHPAEPDDLNEAVDPDFPLATRSRLAGRLPALRAAPVVGGQAGLYDMSADTRAILDRAPGVEGLYVAAGFSGTGFKKAPAVGACMAELVASGLARTVDIQPFRFSRFAEGKPLHGEDYELPADWGHAF